MSVVVCDEVLLRRPTVALLVKKLLPFIRISASIIVLAKARHCPLHGYFLTSLLILSSSLRLHSLSTSSWTKVSTVFSSSMLLTHPAYLISI